jgi:hypothetical protein
MSTYNENVILRERLDEAENFSNPTSSASIVKSLNENISFLKDYYN